MLRRGQQAGAVRVLGVRVGAGFVGDGPEVVVWQDELSSSGSPEAVAIADR